VTHIKNLKVIVKLKLSGDSRKYMLLGLYSLLLSIIGYTLLFYFIISKLYVSILLACLLTLTSLTLDKYAIQVTENVLLSTSGSIVPLSVVLILLSIYIMNLQFLIVLPIGILLSFAACISQKKIYVKEGVLIEFPLLPIIASSSTIVLLSKAYNLKLFQAIALSYISPVIGLLLALDILPILKIRNIMGKTKVMVIGGAGVRDAIYLSGLTSIIITLLLWYSP